MIFEHLTSSSLTAVVGSTGVGKTAFCLNLALKSAFKQKKQVIYFSVEQDSKSIEQRLFAIQTGESIADIRTDNINDDLKVKNDEFVTELKTLKFKIDDTPALTIRHVTECLEQAFRSNQKYDLAVIDYLELMIEENSEVHCSRIISELNLLSKKYKLAILVIAKTDQVLNQLLEQNFKSEDQIMMGSNKLGFDDYIKIENDQRNPVHSNISEIQIKLYSKKTLVQWHGILDKKTGQVDLTGTKLKPQKKKSVIEDVIPAWGNHKIKALVQGWYDPLPIKQSEGSIQIMNKPKMMAFEVSLVGIGYQFEDKKELEDLFEEFAENAELEVRHEPKNQHDPYALAVYYESKKIGYIPKGWNSKIIDAAKLGVRFNFFISKMITYDDFENFRGVPSVLVVPEYFDVTL